MPATRQPTPTQSARRPRRRPFGGLTVRARLALLYGLVSALIGIVPVGLICVLIEHDLGATVTIAVTRAATPIDLRHQPSSKTAPTTGRTSPTATVLPFNSAILVCEPTDESIPTQSQPTSCPPSTGPSGLAREFTAAQLGNNVSTLLVSQMVWYSALALGVLVLLAFGIGWWLAGRALRPVHQMAAATRRLSSANLHERIPLHEPKDELRDLGESFNALLDRLAAAFASQQRFVANVAHELRTPLTIQRATIQIGLGDLLIEPAELAAVRDELLTANRRHEELIDRLLLLARSVAGLDHREPVDLATVVVDAVAPLAKQANDHAVTLAVRTEPSPVEGDPVLLAALVTNLVQNALRYNHPDGYVEVDMSPEGLLVRNTGPQIAADAVEGLFEPFRRLHNDRTGSATGTGLGLSIVRSIVAAHQGEITAQPNDIGGGLTVRAWFPTPDGPSGIRPGSLDHLPDQTPHEGRRVLLRNRRET